jgi:hypothetical protein
VRRQAELPPEPVMEPWLTSMPLARRSHPASRRLD